MRIVRRWMMGYSAFPFPFRRFNNREVEHGKRKEKLRSKREDRIRRKAASLLLDRMFNRVQSSIQSNSILFSWGGGDIIRLASVHKSRGEGRRANRCAIRDLGNSGFRIRTRFRNYPFSLSLSLDDPRFESMDGTALSNAHNELVKPERDSIMGGGYRCEFTPVFDAFRDLAESTTNRRKEEETIRADIRENYRGYRLSMGTILNAKLSLLITAGSPSPFHPFTTPSSLFLSFQASFHPCIGSNDP